MRRLGRRIEQRYLCSRFWAGHVAFIGQYVVDTTKSVESLVGEALKVRFHARAGLVECVVYPLLCVPDQGLQLDDVSITESFFKDREADDLCDLRLPTWLVQHG